MIEYLRKDDYIFCYWAGGNGYFSWLVERGGQLFFFTIAEMKYLNVRHWAYSGKQSEVDVVRNVLGSVGFRECPVYTSFRNAKETIQPLLKDIETYEKTVKQIEEEKLNEAKEGVGTG